MNFAYPIAIRPLSKKEGGGYLAEFPDLPGCMADGETIEEALHESADALASWLKTAKANGDAIPKPLSSSTREHSRTAISKHLRKPKANKTKLSTNHF